MEELKKKTAVLLRSVLVSSPRGVPLSQLNKEYKVFSYSNIPFKEMGFSSVEMFIKNIPDVASLKRNNDGQLVVVGVASEADKHVAKLIAKQKKPKKRSKAGQLRRPTPAKNSLAKRVAVGQFASAPRQFVFSANQAFATNIPALHLAAIGSGRLVQTNRFIPPRMKNRVGNQPFGNRNVSQQRSGPVQVHISNTNSSRKVELITEPAINRTVVERGVARQVEEQALEIASANSIKVTSSSCSEKSSGKKSSDRKSSKTDDEVVYARIKGLIDEKPRGIWLKRIGAEYKKIYNEELSSAILEKLKDLPAIARCENCQDDLVIVYPSKLDEKESPAEAVGKQAHEGQQKGSPLKSLELYTLRPQELPEMGSVSEVIVSHVDSPTHFFIQYNQNGTQIETLGNKLNTFLQANNSDTLPTANQGMFCCGQFTEDDCWYRARITKCDAKGDKVEVIYVDYGNHESLTLSRLRMLRRDEAELPMMAVLCALDGVTSLDGENWSDASIARFKELCEVEMLRMKAVRAKDHHLYVELKDPKGNDLRTVLQWEGLAKRESDDSSSTNSTSGSSSSKSSSLTNSSSTDSFSSVTTTASSSSSQGHASPVRAFSSTRGEKETKEPETKSSSAPRSFLRVNRLLSKEEEVQKIPGRVQIPNEDYLDVFVCNVHSTHNICVNLCGENYSEKLTALEQSMLCHYEEPSSEEPIRVAPGGVYATYSKEIHSEGLWYRVKVVKVKTDNVQIEYLDYGETGTVAVSSLRTIPQRFLELPFQAVTLSLHGVPNTKNAEVILKLKHLTLNKDLVAEVKRKNEDVVAVELFDTSSDDIDINLNRILLLLPDEDMKPNLPKPGGQIEAFVTYATQEGHVFVQTLGGGATRLEELMNDIAEHYSQPTKAAEFVSRPQKEKIYCARCSVDGVWYRALVTQVLPERHVEVHYVDYGNYEKLPISSLREPAKAISHVNSLPFQAVECRLDGTDKKPLTEEQTYMILEKEVLLEVLTTSHLPIVRLFVLSEEDEMTLVNVSDLMGIETEVQDEAINTEQSTEGAGNGTSESFDETGSADGDSIASESSSETSKSHDDSDNTTVPSCPVDLTAPWVDISILEVDNPNLFMVSHNGGF